MRILYCAIDQRVPGSLGGSVHVESVASGLAALGHDVHVAVQRGSGSWPTSGATWHPMAPPFGRNELRWTSSRRIERLARETDAEVIIERYYNFGGEGVFAAKRIGVPAVLEVNAPIVDHPGSVKARVDRALLVRPLHRWRERMCRQADLFVTPMAGILPDWIDRHRILEIEWGADVDHFRPDRSRPRPFTTDPSRIQCVFAGAFRSWHGVVHLVASLARLHAAGDHRFGAVLIGDGPERAAAQRVARDVPGVMFTGALPHDQLPAALAWADVGVAPFDPTRHAALRLGFYWSPLKIFEYMAVGLPVVAPALPRLQRLVDSGSEGLLYDPEDPRGLDRALQTLADPALRRRLGDAARARVVRDFSWGAHCGALDRRLRALVGHP